MRREKTKYLQRLIYISQGPIWSLRGPRRADWRSERDYRRLWKADFRPEVSEGRLKASEGKFEALEAWLRPMESDLYLERADLMFKKGEIWSKSPLGLQIRPEKANLGPLWQDLRPGGDLREKKIALWNHRSSASLGLLPKRNYYYTNKMNEWMNEQINECNYCPIKSVSVNESS